MCNHRDNTALVAFLASYGQFVDLAEKERLIDPDAARDIKFLVEDYLCSSNGAVGDYLCSSNGAVGDYLCSSNGATPSGGILPVDIWEDASCELYDEGMEYYWLKLEFKIWIYDICAVLKQDILCDYPLYKQD